MLRLLATLSPTALLLVGGLVAGLPAAGLAYKAGHWIGHRAGVKDGSAAVVASVETQNREAGEAARRVKTTVDACYDAGGTWRQESGTCDR